MTVWVTNIARTYGHVSLTPVNDTKFMDICHWLQSMTEIYGQTCQKVSLTAVNDKKSVIDLMYTIYGYLWLSQLLVIINSVCYRCFLLLSFSVIGYQQCCWLSPLLLVIINAVGYHHWFLLLTYPVVGDHSLKLEKPLFALLLHKLHQTCLFHAIAVDISWNEKRWK